MTEMLGEYDMTEVFLNWTTRGANYVKTWGEHKHSQINHIQHISRGGYGVFRTISKKLISQGTVCNWGVQKHGVINHNRAVLRAQNKL